MATTFTKYPENGLNGRKIDLPLLDLIKFTQIGIFGLKIYHLATLSQSM
jgi:hypothetical protein